MKTQDIAGHSIRLETGKRYVASRPMASRGRTSYPITIWNASEVLDRNDVHTIPDLNLTDANDFLAEFNNGPVSFDGRVW